MTFFHFNRALLFGRVLVGLSLLGTVILSFDLLGRTWDAAQGPAEVRLLLVTVKPNLFPILSAVKGGWDDGAAGRHRPERGPLPALVPGARGFALAADPQMPLLRYNEPAPWKRVALLYLGASDDLFSLLWIVFISVGSWQLWRLLRDVTPTTPFTFANARRLAGLALLVLVLNLAEYLAYVALRALVPVFHIPELAEPLGHYVQLNTGNTLPGVATGIMLAVIAAVYRHGVELSQEAELVI